MTTPVISRAHLFRSVTDSEGNVTPNTKVTIYERGSTQLLQQTIYSTPSGSGTLTNPFTTSSGFVDIYLAAPQDVAIGVSVAAQGGAEQRFENVGVLPPTDQLVRSPQGFQIMNAPAAGKYVQASEDRKAWWVSADEVMASRPTPTVLLKEYDFSASYLDDLVVRGSSQYVDTSLDVKPDGYGFLQALDFSGSVSVPPLNFRERGRAIFLYKVLSERGGEGAARLQVSIDDRTIWTLTPTSPDFVGPWCVGYLEIMKPGTHQIVFDEIAGSDPDSAVLLGPVTINYGNNIPPHEHAGTYDRSLRLGTGSAALGVRATALGDHAQATEGATAIGAGAEGFNGGTAIGSGAWAAQGSVAVGYRAGGTSGTYDWVSLGAQSTTAGDSSVAVGYDTLAQGDRSLVAGAGATATGEESIALGNGASAEGYRSVALGAGSSAPYDWSMAIGPGVTTQAPHEARLGDSDTVVVMPGSLRHTGAQAVLGAAGSKLGFYGSAPVARPAVRGSRNGNAVLTQLLAQLNAMGLIQDASTA